MRNTRRAVSQAQFNVGPAFVVAVEFLITAALFGAVYRSWVVLCAVLMGLTFCLTNWHLRIALTVFYSGFWSLATVQIGHDIAGVPGAIFIGGFGALVAFGIHLAGVTGLRDPVPSTY